MMKYLTVSDELLRVFLCVTTSVTFSFTLGLSLPRMRLQFPGLIPAEAFASPTSGSSTRPTCLRSPLKTTWSANSKHNPAENAPHYDPGKLTTPSLAGRSFASLRIRTISRSPRPPALPSSFTTRPWRRLLTTPKRRTSSGWSLKTTQSSYSTPDPAKGANFGQRNFWLAPCQIRASRSSSPS